MTGYFCGSPLPTAIPLWHLPLHSGARRTRLHSWELVGPEMPWPGCRHHHPPWPWEHSHLLLLPPRRLCARNGKEQVGTTYSPPVNNNWLTRSVIFGEHFSSQASHDLTEDTQHTTQPVLGLSPMPGLCPRCCMRQQYLLGGLPGVPWTYSGGKRSFLASLSRRWLPHTDLSTAQPRQQRDQLVPRPLPPVSSPTPQALSRLPVCSSKLPAGIFGSPRGSDMRVSPLYLPAPPDGMRGPVLGEPPSSSSAGTRGPRPPCSVPAPPCPGPLQGPGTAAPSPSTVFFLKSEAMASAGSVSLLLLRWPGSCRAPQAHPAPPHRRRGAGQGRGRGRAADLPRLPGRERDREWGRGWEWEWEWGSPGSELALGLSWPRTGEARGGRGPLSARGRGCPGARQWGGKSENSRGFHCLIASLNV